jgi:hypothetical protein
VSSDKIQSTYSYVECSQFRERDNVTSESTCVEFDKITVQVTPVIPPFTYSYQCTSVLITSYTPVFLYSYIFLIVIPPLVYLSLLAFFPDHTALPEALRSRLPGILYPDMWSSQPPVHFDITSRPSSLKGPTRAPAAAVAVNTPLHPAQHPAHDGGSVSTRNSLLTAPSQSADKLVCAEGRQLLRSDNILAPMLMHTAVLLTFGLCCPYLAVTIAVAVIVGALRWRLLLGRFVVRRLQLCLGYDAVAEAAWTTGKSDDGKRLVVKVQNDSGYCDVIDHPESSGLDHCLVVLGDTLRDMHVTGGMCLKLQVSSRRRRSAALYYSVSLFVCGAVLCWVGVGWNAVLWYFVLGHHCGPQGLVELRVGADLCSLGASSAAAVHLCDPRAGGVPGGVGARNTHDS